MQHGIAGVGAGRAAGIGLEIGGELRPSIHRPDPGQRDAFTDTLTRMLNDTSAAVDTASDLQQRFLRGENVELHQVTAASEEAALGVELLTSVRDKVLDAYRQLVSMS